MRISGIKTFMIYLEFKEIVLTSFATDSGTQVQCWNIDINHIFLLYFYFQNKKTRHKLTGFSLVHAYTCILIIMLILLMRQSIARTLQK